WGANTLQSIVPYGYAGTRWEDAAAPDEDTNQDGTADKLALYQMGARWYDPELGRFLETDPIGETGGLNLYNYVGSSPTLFIDPSGLRSTPKISGEEITRDYIGGRAWQDQLKAWADKLNFFDHGSAKRWTHSRSSDDEYYLRKARAEIEEEKRKKAREEKRKNTSPEEKGATVTSENSKETTDTSKVATGASDSTETACSGGPAFQPELWNDDENIREENNCYNYVTDTITNTRAQPGEARGYVFDRITCGTIDRGLRLDKSKPSTGDQGCPEGMHKGFLEVKEGLRIEGGGDYHFYRQDADCGWSSKLGRREARKEPWSDPSGRVIRSGYKDCGFYCFPTGNARIN
ncbi:MAG: RHS repeat-associated core domain-containing protein, partial [Caldisericales bacterium]|nr:RHS repeat-associated core domain-containing protein [Caldisericales bacterium]